jgi:Protein of unknown function (DUF3617)
MYTAANRRAILLAAALLAAALLAPAGAAAQTAAPLIEPGQWEIRIATRAGTDPNNKLPDRTARHCYTPAEARDLKRVLPTHINGEQCRLLDTKRDGGNLTYRLQCDRNNLVMAGEMKFEGTRYEGTVITEFFGAEVGVGRIEQRIKARRTGACDKPPAQGSR